MKNNAKELIRQRFIEPTSSPRTNYIGIEIEMPVVSLKGEKTDQSVSASALKEEEAKWYRPFSSFGKSPIARAFRKRSALTSFTR